MLLVHPTTDSDTDLLVLDPEGQQQEILGPQIVMGDYDDDDEEEGLDFYDDDEDYIEDFDDDFDDEPSANEDYDDDEDDDDL